MARSKRTLAVSTLTLSLVAALPTAPAWAETPAQGPAKGSPQSLVLGSQQASHDPLDPILHGPRGYGALLSTYVTPGGVRYAAWRANADDVAALGSVVSRLSAIDAKALPPSDRTALYIDLYNARVLQLILKENPRTSIKEITPGITGFGVFLKPSVKLGTESLSLRQLEDRLREEAKDPRIHFAINCASRSCPPIAAEPYRGATLNDQLDHATRSFLATRGALVLKEGATEGSEKKDPLVVEASKIFDWYEKDFKATGGALAFIEKYGPPGVAEEMKKAGKSVKLTAQDYDWSLNAAP